MKEVSKEEFFAVIGPQDVHPRIVNDWDDRIGYIQEWQLQRTRQTVGRSETGVFPKTKPRWFLPA